MKKDTDTALSYSLSDLIRFMESPFASWLERVTMTSERRGALERDAEDPDTKLLADAGNTHEVKFS